MKKLLQPPQPFDVLILSFFTILITWQPYFLHGNINEFELGLYLPGIDAVLKGQVPFRDVFHLRGPLELYVPALLMKLFGENIAVLSSYFYVGNVLTLILCIFLAREILSSRLFFYLLIPILVTRTFPRVVFAYWGGMRFAFGILAVWCAVKFFRRQKPSWMFWAGFVSILGLLTSVEIGICALSGIVAGLIFSSWSQTLPWPKLKSAIFAFLGGIACVAIPAVMYFIINGAFIPYLEAVYTVVTKMQTTINLNFISEIPNNPREALIAMVNPVSANFKQMTPAYCYLFFLVYLFWQKSKKNLTVSDCACICLGVYGLVMYKAAFRAIHASQFEMALQPEKILYFFLLEKAAWIGLDPSTRTPAMAGGPSLGMEPNHKKSREQIPKGQEEGTTPACRRGRGMPVGFHTAHPNQMQQNYFLSLTWQNSTKAATQVFLIIMVIVSISYSIQRFNHRFFVFKYVRNALTRQSLESLKPLAGEESKELQLERLKGMVVPTSQAKDIEGVNQFIRSHTAKGEKVLMFPELGFYQFLVDRPWVGRFPMVPFSWFKEDWHQEFLKDLKASAPNYAVISKDPGTWFPDVYFRLPENKAKYDEVVAFINEHYSLVASTPSFSILRRRP